MLQKQVIVRVRPRGEAELSGKAIGGNRPPRKDRLSGRARNGAEARNCQSMPQQSVVERSHIAFAVKISLDSSSDGAANLSTSWRSAKSGGPARPYVSWDRGTRSPCHILRNVITPYSSTEVTRSRSLPWLPSCGSRTSSTGSPRLAHLWGQQSTSPEPWGGAGRCRRWWTHWCSYHSLCSPTFCPCTVSTHGAPHADGAPRCASVAHASYGCCRVAGAGSGARLAPGGG